eukprot:360066-Chlamydomonas_euryale.AAC.2
MMLCLLADAKFRTSSCKAFGRRICLAVRFALLCYVFARRLVAAGPSPLAACAQADVKQLPVAAVTAGAIPGGTVGLCMAFVLGRVLGGGSFRVGMCIVWRMFGFLGWGWAGQSGAELQALVAVIGIPKPDRTVSLPERTP